MLAPTVYVRSALQGQCGWLAQASYYPIVLMATTDVGFSYLLPCASHSLPASCALPLGRPNPTNYYGFYRLSALCATLLGELKTQRGWQAPCRRRHHCLIGSYRRRSIWEGSDSLCLSRCSPRLSTRVQCGNMPCTALQPGQ